MKFVKISPSSLIMAAAASMALGQGAMAQSMDYGALQDLFGEPVTTSATGKPQRASEAPAAMTIVTAEEITKSGARTLPDVLNRVAGVNVLQWTIAGGDVGVRGYNQGYNPRLLVLVNGRQVYQDYYGVTIWSGIPVQLSEIRQIEVVKGPQSALFGFNAASGVVNIVTYNPLYDSVNGVDVTFGNFGHKEINAVATVKLGERGGVRVSAGGWDMGPYTTAMSTTVARLYNSDAMRRTASLDSLYQVTPDLQAGFEATWGRRDEFQVNPSGAPGSSIYDTYSLKGTLKADTDWGLIDVTTYDNELDVKLRSPRGEASTSTSTKVLQVQDLIKLSDQLTTRIGLEYRDNSVESFPVRGAKSGYENYALSNMYAWQINPSLSFTVALRGDHTALNHKGGVPYPFTSEDYDRSFTSLSYNAGFVWQLTPQDTLLAAAGRGVGSPSLAELLNNAVTRPAVGTLQVAGNPNLDPTIATSYELGWRHTIDAINGFGSVSVSHQKIEDMKFLNLSRPQLINGYPTLLIGTNLGSSAAWTVESELRGSIDAFRWNLSWVWMDTNDDLTISNVSIGQNYEESNPRHTVKANLGWDSGKWSYDTLLIWKSKTHVYFDDGSGSRLVEVSPGLTAQASVGYQVSDALRLSLSGANLLRKETELTVAPKAERRVWATASYKF